MYLDVTVQKAKASRICSRLLVLLSLNTCFMELWGVSDSNSLYDFSISLRLNSPLEVGEGVGLDLSGLGVYTVF